jgi:hypothetical protein
MIKVIIKSIILSISTLATVFSVIYLAPIDKNKYLGASIDKHKRLAKLKGPRIIFTGDSSLAFGLDSAMIQKETGYNIVNMSLIGGLGPIFCIDEIKSSLKKSDIVIMAFDYQNYFTDGSGLNSIVEVTIFNPEVMSKFSAKTWDNYLKNFPIAFQRRLSGLIIPALDDIAFVRYAFNEYGDNVGHTKLPRPQFGYAPRQIPLKMNDDLAKFFNGFNDHCLKNGIKCFITFSPLLIEDKQKQKMQLEKLMKSLNNQINIQAIGKPWDFMYPFEDFYNNVFHLNGIGREKRTKDLINQMKKIPLFNSLKKAAQ